METKTVRLYSLDYSNARTYLMAALFIAGNMALPQLFHLIPQGGITWLPIYFFTLIGAYKFGWKVGLLTAVFSPVIVRDASSGSASRHSVEVRITGSSSRLGSTSFQPYLSAYPIGRCTVLSGSRYSGRMGYGGQLLPSRTGFPYRAAGNGNAGSRRLCADKV